MNVRSRGSLMFGLAVGWGVLLQATPAAGTPPAAGSTASLFPALLPTAFQGSISGGAHADPERLMEEGNRRYQNNDFFGAVEAYREVLDAGYESATLYYNLGNAHFKNGDLGRAILNYERALLRDPGDPDTRANLELARSLTADAIEPMPRFWILSALDWWVHLLGRTWLIALVALSWVACSGALSVRILSRRVRARSLAGWTMAGGGAGLLIFGITLLARAGVLGGKEWGVILAEEVAVQSAPSSEDDLTLFHIHQGTKVRLDQHTQEWSEVVLEDGRVGWVPSGSLEEI